MCVSSVSGLFSWFPSSMFIPFMLHFPPPHLGGKGPPSESGPLGVCLEKSYWASFWPDLTLHQCCCETVTLTGSKMEIKYSWHSWKHWLMAHTYSNLSDQMCRTRRSRRCVVLAVRWSLEMDLLQNSWRAENRHISLYANECVAALCPVCTPTFLLSSSFLDSSSKTTDKGAVLRCLMKQQGGKWCKGESRGEEQGRRRYRLA